MGERVLFTDTLDLNSILDGSDAHYDSATPAFCCGMLVNWPLVTSGS